MVERTSQIYKQKKLKLIQSVLQIGKVNLEAYRTIHPVILRLLTGSDFISDEFRKMIRLYNSILSFTSMKASVDESLANSKTGNYTYRINCAVHHCISNLLPEERNASDRPDLISRVFKLILDELFIDLFER